MLNKKFFQKDIYIVSIWMLLPIINWVIDFPNNRYNNYKIFSSMFWHMIDGKNLYLAYPSEHGDLFYYGPAFSLIIAPFAVLPNVIGGLLWGLFNTLILVYSLNKLRLKTEFKILLMLLSTIELANSIWSHQFNPCVAAMIILSFTMVEDENDFYAAFWILLGAFTKVYGAIGLIFFLFSKNKSKFITGCVVWSIVFFIAPMIFTSPGYIIQTYVDWYHSLMLKNTQLIHGLYSDLSVMGVFRKISGYNLGNSLFLFIGLVMLLMPLLRLKQYQSKYFRMYILSSILMFVVLFSTASEHPTYIICIVGLFLWMVLQNNIFSRWNLAMIFFVLMVTGLGPTYIFSEEVALFILQYGLKAIPCIIIWVLIAWQLMNKDFTSEVESNRFLA